MGEFSIMHILIVGLIFLMFFGPSRLPQLGQSLGKAIRGFKSGLNEIDVDAKDIHDAPKQADRSSDQIVQNQTQTTTQTKVENTETIKKS
jgi:sec-independent protein translocase protein TatA